MLTENDVFLTELGKLFSKSRTAGTSLRIVFKKHDGRTKPHPNTKPKKKPWTFKPKGGSAPSSPHQTSGDPRCLVRATLGSAKVSTNVLQKDMNKFQVAFTSSLKTNIDGLKKKDKKAEKKGKGGATGQQAQPSSSTTTK